jgi:hypothetical protein
VLPGFSFFSVYFVSVIEIPLIQNSFTDIIASFKTYKYFCEEYIVDTIVAAEEM